MSAIVEMIENLINDGYTVTIAPAQGLGYFDQPITEFFVTTSKDGVMYGQGTQPVFQLALDDAYMLTPYGQSSIRASVGEVLEPE